MTREEFIKNWGGLAAGVGSSIERLEDGVRIGDRRRFALPCACGDESCNGWAMVAEEDVDDHMALYASPLQQEQTGET